MAFVDEITLHLKSGDGGDGVVSWLHEKGKEFMGPAGGDGGKGGDVYFKAVRDIARLFGYRYGNLFVAKSGGAGEKKSRHGKNGEDMELEAPIGSVITNQKTGRTYELLAEGEQVRVLHGGRGGFGNEHFKSSRNVRPKERTLGRAGEEADFHIELRLFADAGLIGLPNAGKSSLLNELTRARAKVASYAFTTLEPNLGAYEGFILADIPGLIEGAHKGKGLGIKFLKHITRTKLLLHCISLDPVVESGVALRAKPDAAFHYGVKRLLESYETVRRELKAFSPELATKQEIILLTKIDLVEEAVVKKALQELKKKDPQVYAVSVIDDVCLVSFKHALLDILRHL